MSLKGTIGKFASRLLAFQQSESKFVWILIATFSLILLNPFVPNQGWGGYIFHLLLLFIVLSGILAASDERQIIRQIVAIGLAVVILDWTQSLAREDFPGLALLVYALYAIFVAFITMAIILEVVKSPKVTTNIICGAVAGYLLIGLTGMFIALFMEGLNPGNFLADGEVLSRQGLANALLYYSMVSLSTIGYGDITPVTPAARSLSLAIGLLGQIYLTVLVAMLVGKFLKD